MASAKTFRSHDRDGRSQKRPPKKRPTNTRATEIKEEVSATQGTKSEPSDKRERNTAEHPNGTTHKEIGTTHKEIELYLPKKIPSVANPPKHTVVSDHQPQIDDTMRNIRVYLS